MASRGRGPDTTLVHMAPGEVQSLQALAKAHGGSLTINPATGLPEAGFLSSILPMVIGAGLTAAGVPAPIAGMLVGGAQAARTGSIQKGLMAGFGAYGGSSIGAGFMNAGAQGLAAAAIPTVDAGAAMAAGAGDATANLAANATVPTGMAGNLSNMGAGVQNLTSTAGRDAFMQNIGGGKGLAMAGLAAASPMLFPETTTKQPTIAPGDANMGQRYSYSPGAAQPTPAPDVPGYGNQGQNFGGEQTYFRPQYTQISNDAARKLYGYANGGPVESMSANNSIGANTGYPQADIRAGAYATPYQDPMSRNVVSGAQDVAVDPYTGQEQRTEPAPQAQFAEGGVSHLGDYSDGGRLLRGPGDGVSDDIPAMIGKKQPARLADGEFVVPARIVSELGNGSTEAGARKLYAMMDRVQKSRGSTVGKGKIATNSRADKHLPA